MHLFLVKLGRKERKETRGMQDFHNLVAHEDLGQAYHISISYRKVCPRERQDNSR